MPKCQCCFLEFGFFKKEDYCRKCNKFYCQSCAPKTTVLPTHGPKPVRVCNSCYAIVTAQPASSSPTPSRPVTTPQAPIQQRPPPYSTQAPVVPVSTDIPRFLQTHWNIPPAPQPTQLPPSSLTQPTPANSDFDPDLLPKFLKPSSERSGHSTTLPIGLRPQVTNPTSALPVVGASDPTQHSDAHVTEDDEWKLRLLGAISGPSTLGAPTATAATAATGSDTPEPPSAEELQLRLAKLQGGKQASSLDEDELIERFAKLSGHPPVLAYDKTDSVFLPDSLAEPGSQSLNPVLPENPGNRPPASQPSADLTSNPRSSLQAQQDTSGEASEIARIMRMARLEAEVDARVEASGLKVKERTEEKQPKKDEEECPWCCICNEDASLKCPECDDDLFCQRCFLESHRDSGDLDHKPKSFKAHKSADDDAD